MSVKTPYLRKGDRIKLQFLDGTTGTAKKLILSGLIEEVPEFQEPVITAENEDFLISGVLKGMTEGDDASTFNQSSFTVYALDDQVSAGKNKIMEFLKKKLDGATELVSKNTGSITVVDQNGIDTALSITTNKFLFECEVLFTSDVDEKDFGYKFLVFINDVVPSTTDNKVSMTITMTPYSKLTPISTITE